MISHFHQYERFLLIRVAIIEAENRQIEREIATIVNETKPDESKSIEAIVESTETSRHPKTGHRRVPGCISSHSRTVLSTDFSS